MKLYKKIRHIRKDVLKLSLKKIHEKLSNSSVARRAPVVGDI